MIENAPCGENRGDIFRAYVNEYQKWKAARDVLVKMAAESPRCVMLGIYETQTGYLLTHITDGTILDPEAFSSFMAIIHSAADEAMAVRFDGHLNPINHVMVETERFMMISRRMDENHSVVFVLRSPVECLGMPIELLDRWGNRLLETLAGSGSPPVS